jgi:hypothetical protein
MPDRYFDKFQKIAYANNVAINITERSIVLNSVRDNPYLFYPFDISNGVRPDQIADTYYNDQYLSWLIYLGNNMIDPYYEWYLQNDEFEKFLKKKYSVTNTDILKQKVKFYRNNWYESEQISVQAYNAEIANTPLVKYWEPVYNGSYKPIAYQRKQKDWIVDTNNMVTYYCDFEGGTDPFINDEIVDIVFDQNFQGKAQIAKQNLNWVTVKHTFGYTMTEPVVELKDSDNKTITDEFDDFLVMETTAKIIDGSYIRGRESGVTVKILEASQFLVNNDTLISSTEAIYWSPVYIYDYEAEQNESKKSIRLLNKVYAPQAVKELADLMG